MYQPAIEASEKLGKDLIIVTHGPDDLPSSLPEHVTAVPSLSLLPKHFLSAALSSNREELELLLEL